jgi:hypothetical protein
MQNGRGVTNYQSGNPSHGLSGRTTEFDDELMRRGIVTAEQVYLAKEAPPEEAQRLAQQLRERNQPTTTTTAISTGAAFTNTAKEEANGESDDESLEDDDEDDDEFLQQYRQERIKEMQQQQQQQEDAILHISREEWTLHVNQASQSNRWVLVALINENCRDRVIQELRNLQRRQPENCISSMVTIIATDAIPNWPVERVPTLFAYCNGIKQHEWIASRAGEWPGSMMALIQEQWKIGS